VGRSLSERVEEVCAEVVRLYPELGRLCTELEVSVKALELESEGFTPEEVLAVLRGRAL